GAKAALNMAAAYANERKAFGHPLADFGMIKKKLAYMAAEVYAAEAIAFRTVGMVEDARLKAGEDRMAQLAAIEEYAIECSIAKVYCSEVLGRNVDEGVQVFGGYGFMDEYPISHAWRDARINRIFEGTNEVNRLVTSGTLFRRAMDNKIDLFSVFPEIEAQVSSGQAPDFADETTPAELRDAVNLAERVKRASIYASMKGAMKFMATMQDEQEFLEYAANQIITSFAIDSAVARALTAARSGAADAHTHALLANVATINLVREARAALEGALTMTFEGEERKAELTKVRAYLGDPQADIVPLQRELAGVVSATGAYPLK
ncbi:MAG: acyl-CoA dehydrogenase, partial [Chloroflexota bacterium]|nr:acyl-CoA dehydrogenase [Chloroflexota bacterium]